MSSLTVMGKLKSAIVQKLSTVILQISVRIEESIPPTSTSRAMKLTNWLMRILINMIRGINFGPHQYNYDTGMYISNSAWYGRIHHSVIICIVGVATFVQTLSVFRDISQNELDVLSPLGSFRILKALFSLVSTVILLNLSLNAERVKLMWNLMLIYTNTMSSWGQRQNFRVKITDYISFGLTLSIFVAVTLVECFDILLYFIDCKFYFLGGIVPACNLVGSHRHWAIMALLTAFQFFITFQYYIAVVITACVILVGVQGIIAHFEMQRNMIEGLNSEEDMDQWNVRYRVVNIFIDIHFHAFGEVVVPVFFLLVVLILVMGNCVMILPQTLFFTRCLAMTMSTGFIIFLTLVIYFASLFPIKSTELLNFRRQSSLTSINSKYTLRYLKSCQPYRIYVGHFFYLSSSVLPEMLNIVLDNTISVLLI